VTRKVVSPDEAYAKAVDKTSLEAGLKRLGINLAAAPAAAPRPAPVG